MRSMVLVCNIESNPTISIMLQSYQGPLDITNTLHYILILASNIVDHIPKVKNIIIMAIITPAPPSLPSSVGGTIEDTIMKSDAIRSRLLYKLGMYDPNLTNASIYHTIRCDSSKKKSQQQPRQQEQTRLPPSSSQEESQDTNSRLSPYFVPLNFQEDSQGSDSNSPHRIPSNASSSLSSSEPPSNMDESKSRQRSAFVQFDPSVAVISIPSHRSHSPRMHARSYIPQEELASAIVRNTREFVYERWDWHNVIEEDRMYISKASGELIHPAHVGYKRVRNPYL